VIAPSPVLLQKDISPSKCPSVEGRETGHTKWSSGLFNESLSLDGAVATAGVGEGDQKSPLLHLPRKGGETRLKRSSYGVGNLSLSLDGRG
jgi:hypothetical protein